MVTSAVTPSHNGIHQQDIQYARNAFWNLGTSQLVEHAIVRGEGTLASGGPLVVRTGEHTGRSPGDRFVVRDARTENTVNWGACNQPLLPSQFDALHGKLMAYLQNRDLFIQDCYAGADRSCSIPIRVITELAWHSLIARQLFVRASRHTSDQHVPQFTIICAPGFHANPQVDGTASPVFVIINFTRRMVLIGGTAYAGEMKKALFTVLNYLLPDRDVLPMQCSANVGDAGDVALFFGLSGTGKTTLAFDPERRLVGDDEHGWSSAGIFNLEGGSYAKCIRISRQNEPHVWAAMRFGTVIENAVMDQDTRVIDFNDASVTENTRAVYPLSFVEHAPVQGAAGQPAHLVFLACDVFGVLPPIARLTPEQAIAHFICGYTAKIGATERRAAGDPEPTFSPCYGGAFLPRPSKVYAEMLAAKMRSRDIQCWLLNTGWTGGPYGIGQRVSLPVTRALLRAALGGYLDGVKFKPSSAFHCLVPESCPGVDDRMLDARQLWMDRSAYDRSAQELMRRFERTLAVHQPVSAAHV